MNREQELIITDWINRQIDDICWDGRNTRPMIWTMLHKANMDFSTPMLNPANDPFAMFCLNSVNDLFGEERASRMIRGAINIKAPNRIVRQNPHEVRVKDSDPDLEALLREEEEIEQRIREGRA